MGKASRNKKLKRQQAANIERYGRVKLSEALLNICEPFNYNGLSLSEYRELIGMTSVVWNIARNDQNKRVELLLESIKTMPGLHNEFEADLITLLESGSSPNEDLPTSIAILNILNTLMQRKDELYPDDDRVVVDYTVKEIANERHLSVSSAMPDTSDKSFLA